jgi:hypothetical protein
MPETTHDGIYDYRQESGRVTRHGGADYQAAIYPPLYCARIDRAILRHGAVA